MLAGVCGGLADWIGWDASVVRAICIIGLVTTAVVPGLLAYLMLWAALPEAATVTVVAKEAPASESS